MKNFSILFPTRHRVEKLKSCLQSIRDTVKDKANIEVLVAYDNDDVETCSIIDDLADFKDINLSTFMFDRIYNLHQYYNLLYQSCDGKTIITLNDDTKFLTYGWDEIAQKHIDDAGYEDGIYYGYIDDLLKESRHGKYCCFPFISRKFIEIVGCVQDERFLGGGADIYIGNLFHELDRVIDMRDIQIDHISCHNYLTMPLDHIAVEVKHKLINCPYPFKVYDTQDIQEHLGMVKEYINDFRRCTNPDSNK